jgi:hypothetical protein
MFLKAGTARLSLSSAAGTCLFAAILTFAMPQMLKLLVSTPVSLKVKLSD